MKIYVILIEQRHLAVTEKRQYMRARRHSENPFATQTPLSAFRRRACYTDIRPPECGIRGKLSKFVYKKIERHTCC